MSSLRRLKSKLLPCEHISARERLLPADYENIEWEKVLEKELRNEVQKKLEEQIKQLRNDLFCKSTKSILKEYEREKMKFAIMNDSSFGKQALSQNRSSSSLVMSQSRIKTEPELIVYNKREIPSSAAYNLKSTIMQDTFGGKFSTANVPGFIDMAQRQGSQLPGPSEYGDVSKSRGVSGGKFNSANVPGFIAEAQRVGKSLPSPIDYKPSHRVTPTGRRSTGNVAKFSNCYPKSDVDWLVYHARQIPGPGAYDVNKGNGIGKSGGGQKFSTSYNIKSFAEEAICKTMDVPGPKYDPGGLGVNKEGLLWDVGGLTKYSHNFTVF